ncbi:MAG: class I SAM-dependent methyltransferase, partial [Synergistaceae bacterium]|nr:class I SAM-dependent methyltransferase [Synergistaceae bacterium]
RTSKEIEKNYSFDGKRVLDLGCGDGRYSLYLASNLPVKFVMGIDPAESAIEMDNEKAKTLGLQGKVRFQSGDIYNLNFNERFDCIILRGVLHHLPDPELALKKAALLDADTLIIVEPNGWNPVLKILERFSPYHVEHGEKSFLPGTIIRWLKNASCTITYNTYVNLVPMFCPDWMAKICKTCEPLAEMLPIVRNICCGQFIVIAQKIR